MVPFEASSAPSRELSKVSHSAMSAALSCTGHFELVNRPTATGAHGTPSCLCPHTATPQNDRTRTPTAPRVLTACPPDTYCISASHVVSLSG